MVVRYLILQITRRFFLILTLLVASFAAVNVVTKGVSFTLDVFVALFLGSIAFMSVFVYPIALMGAVFVVFYDLQNQGEGPLLLFWNSLQKKILARIIAFSLATTMLFIPLIFFVAPASYGWGKRLLYALIEQKISQLPSGKFHTITPQLSMYFEEQEKINTNQTAFKSFYLTFSSKDKSYIEQVIYARLARLQDNYLTIFDGYVIRCNKNLTFDVVGFFTEGLFDIATLLNGGKEHFDNSVAPRYRNIIDLWINKSREGNLEVYKRLFQIFFVFLTVLAAYFIAFVAVARLQLLTIPSIMIITMAWFFSLYFYLFLLPVIFSHKVLLWAIFFIPVLVTILLYRFYRKAIF